MTLDEMIRQTAEYAGVEDDLFENGDTINGAYKTDSDAVKIKNKFITSINTAINRIAKDKKLLTFTETVRNKDINPNYFIKKFLAVKEIKDLDGNPVYWYKGVENKIICPDYEDTEKINITYYYIPEVLENLSDEVEIQDGIVDPILYCYYAAGQYFEMEGDDTSIKKSQIWMNRFYEGYNSITSNIGEIDTIKNVYGW